jgi:hypothetical protein
VSLLDEVIFGGQVAEGAARRTSVLVATPEGDLETCSFIGQVDQLDSACFSDCCLLMQDLCRKARSGEPLASLFDAAWRELDAWQAPYGADVMSVSTFLLTRGNVGVLGFSLAGGDVVVVSCRKGRRAPNRADLTRCRGEAEAYCDCLRRNVIEILSRR